MNLLDSVEELKGVGQKTAETLKKAGIRTIRDFFYNLPRDYEHYASPTTIREMRPGKVVIKGKIDSLSSRHARRRNLSITEGIVRDSSGAVKVVWFNQSYRLRQFAPDKEYYFTGVYELKNGRYQITSPSAALVSDVDMDGGISPIYVAHGKLKSHGFRRLINNSRDRFNEIPDLLPGAREGARKEALFKVHFPSSVVDIGSGREYLAYEELYEYILAAKLNRKENEKLKAEKIEFDLDKTREFIGSLPFKLTNAQRLAAWEIFKDMNKETPMNRLLQGDVGSGKTMVAALAALDVVLSGRQVALLAPTAILALQHFDNLSSVLKKFGVRVALLTGATKKKSEIKKQIVNKEIDLVVGTHALLTDDTEFNDLSLVIIDEQHRFGVEQRQKLMLKSPSGLAPHLLSMTATPIPRSLQLTVFGDLDVSVLNELPAGRQPIETKIIPEIEMRSTLYPKMREITSSKPDAKKHGEKAHGQQIYWICKAIDSATGEVSSEITSVKTRTRKLRELFPDKCIEFLHGKMKPAEKDLIMERFSSGEIDILVSTTVVEVGVDVPNASLIIIENAKSYGLAQLHQLRGRVGRGSVKAYCYLITDNDSRPSRRLLELEKSNDGFYLAEVDLKLRGPGEIYGALQHGALDLRIASFSDTKLIAKARKDVDRFLQNGKNMLEYKELMSIISKYQQLTTLN